jgi:uncharacterized ion transporter superfamily protein YfcC
MVTQFTVSEVAAMVIYVCMYVSRCVFIYVYIRSVQNDRVSVLRYSTFTQSPKKLPVAVNLLSPNLST